MAVDPIGSITGSAPAGGSSSAPPKTSGVSSLANESTFLNLLVAQLKNQNPLNPQDGTQFVAQLAQFSDLEQTIQMRNDIGAIRTSLTNYLNANSGTPAGSTDSTPKIG